MATPSRSPLAFVADLAPGERAFTGLMLAYFVLVTTTFWILKPLKKALFIEFYDTSGLDLFSWHLAAAEAELVAKFLNMLVAIVAMVVFATLARRLRRERLSLVLTAGFIVIFALYAFVLDRPRDAAVWSFYLVGDLFSTVMVAAFFAFLNDTVSPAAAKRLYGPIGFGGVAGGVFGAMVLSTLIGRLDAAAWLWICAGLGGVVALAALAAGRAARGLPPSSRAPEVQAEKRPDGGRNPAIEGAALVLGSRYLLSIVAIVGLYEMVSTVMDFQFTSTVAANLQGAAIGAQMSRVFAITNVVSLLVQLFVTGFVMSRLGVGVALLVLPATALAASAVFLVRPSLWTGSLLNTADNGFNYSINQSAKEALYVPTSPTEKYQAKAFIDMFLMRLAKAGSSLLILAAMAWWLPGSEAVHRLGVISLVIVVVWALLALRAGRNFEREVPAAGADGREARPTGPAPAAAVPRAV